MKFSIKGSSTVETKRWTLILSYLSLFVILIVGLNDHFTQFVTIIFAFVNKLDNSFLEDVHAQNPMNYSGYEIVVYSYGIDSSNEANGIAVKNVKVTNHIQKGSSQDWTPFSKEAAIPPHIFGMLYDNWTVNMDEEGVIVFLRGYEKRGYEG